MTTGFRWSLLLDWLAPCQGVKPKTGFQHNQFATKVQLKFINNKNWNMKPKIFKNMRCILLLSAVMVMLLPSCTPDVPEQYRSTATTAPDIAPVPVPSRHHKNETYTPIKINLGGDQSGSAVSNAIPRLTEADVEPFIQLVIQRTGELNVYMINDVSKDKIVKLRIEPHGVMPTQKRGESAEQFMQRLRRFHVEQQEQAQNPPDHS